MFNICGNKASAWTRYRSILFISVINSAKVRSTTLSSALSATLAESEVWILEEVDDDIFADEEE